MSSLSAHTPLKDRLIGDRAFYLRVLQIVVPVIIQNTISNVVSLLDNVMVGQVGTLEMSAVAIVNQLMFIFYLCIFGGMAGPGIFATQYAGAKDDAGVRFCFRIQLYVAVLMSALALLVFLIFPRQLIGLYLAEGTAASDAAATTQFGLNYLYVMLVGIVPFAFTQHYVNSLRAVGETRLPMLASIVAILVNLVFNYFLIFGHFGFPEMGVTGAAIATVLSRFVECAIVVFYTHFHHRKFSFIEGAYRSLRIPGPLFKDILQKGMPLLINEFLWSTGMAMLMQCYSVRGLDVVAATNIASTITNLFNVVFMSMGSAVAIMVGQALGANDPDVAKNTAYRITALSVASCAVMGTLLFLFSPLIPNAYNTEPHVRQLATSLLRSDAILMALHAFAHCCYFTLRSGGRTFITFLFDSAFTWCITFSSAYLLVHYTTLAIEPLYFITKALDVLKCVIGFILLVKGIWIRNIVAAE